MSLRTASNKELIEKMLGGNVRALSRLMSVVERDAEAVDEIMKEVYPRRRPARRIGLAGPPGAGKSTLLGNLIKKASGLGLRVGVLCIDPTSPITGGALLGDRIRLAGTYNLKDVFIRSVASGESLGGLAEATKYHTLLLEAFGADVILIETVGLGQVGYDIRNVAETLLLVLVPESGDTIQILKSGILELADVTIVNKADRDGADEIAETLLYTFAHPRDGWQIPVIKCVARDNAGTDDIWDCIERHYEYLKETGRLESYHDPRTDLREALEFQFQRLLRGGLVDTNPLTKALADKVEAGEADPYSASSEIFKILFKGDPHERDETENERGVRAPAPDD